MATIPTLTQPEIAIVDGQAVTSHPRLLPTSSKRHDDVLKKIRTLECSASFTSRTFSVSDYTDCTGRKTTLLSNNPRRLCVSAMVSRVNAAQFQRGIHQCL